MSDHPKTHCYNPDFKYTASKDTDIKKTFARIRREQKAALDAKKLQPVPQKMRRVI